MTEPIAMITLILGAENYHKQAKETHFLTELTEFLPDLNDREKAVLKVLSSFSIWAGKYPAPKERYHTDHEEVYKISQEYQLSLRDVIGVAEEIMNHAKQTAQSI